MTAWLGDEGKDELPVAVRSVRGEDHDKVSILFTARNDHTPHSRVDIFIWPPEPQGGWKAYGYRLSMKRVLELAMAETAVTSPEK
jgi:hypothetical protein